MSELRNSARKLARIWWPVAIAVPLGAVAGAGYAVLTPPVYSANSYVVVVPESGGDGALAVNFAQAYGRLAGQPQVLIGAAADAGRSSAELASLVTGTTSPDAPVIEIDGTGGRPQDAVRSADAVARSLVAFANTSSKETGVKLVPLAAAADPAAPTTPSHQLDVAVGAAAGVLVGSLVMMTRRRSAPTGEPAEPAAVVPGPSPEPVPTPEPEPAPAGRSK
ncbi:capsular polysaccharide biosynthesis protein [Kitasatospora sp. MAA4]|uniref:lipopolysaccharide biosynthesis protein n=1 Tax=Kitasatospora sp. MAA4 TaxID=3035093 RepID=UPI0024750E6A|nr:lipopolysaccharide biosynthesis protein [Kitasatospora sp. MAA4]MDH6134360.1 capsular polysaccharide biosynthesis protein [Kitasatospora sp. MAA4]